MELTTRQSRPGSKEKHKGSSSSPASSKAMTLSGLGELMVCVPLGRRAQSAHGVLLRGGAILGPARRALEVQVHEAQGPAYTSRSGGDTAPDFLFAYHGLMLPGTQGQIELRRAHTNSGDLPIWSGNQIFLTGHIFVQLMHLEVIIPGHGWIAIMRIEPEEQIE